MTNLKRLAGVLSAAFAFAVFSGCANENDVKRSIEYKVNKLGFTDVKFPDDADKDGNKKNPFLLIFCEQSDEVAVSFTAKYNSTVKDNSQTLHGIGCGNKFGSVSVNFNPKQAVPK